MQEYFHEYAQRWIHTPDHFETKGGLFIIHLGRNVAKPNYSSGPRQTGHYTFHFVQEGEVEFLYGSEKVVLGKGDMFCKFPHTMYTYRLHPSGSPLRMTWLAFNGSQAGELMQMAGFSAERMYRRNVLNEELELILRQVAKTPAHLGKKQLVHLNGLLHRIFAELLPDEDDAALTQSNQYWIQKSLEFIHTYYTEKVTVNDVAKYVGIHRTHFSKTFSEKVGTPPAKYLQKLRLDKAKQLLQQTSLTVTEIALSVGFLDLYPFTRAFTKQFGCSPTRMRRGSNCSLLPTDPIV